MSESPPAPATPPRSAAGERLQTTLARIGNVVGFLPSLLILLSPRSGGPDRSPGALRLITACTTD